MSRRAPSEAQREQLQAYHDGELRGLRRWRMERRLRRSPALRRELEALRRLSGWIREAGPAAPSPDLWEAIALRLPAADARRSEAAPRSGWLGWLWPGAALAGALGLALLVLQSPDSPRPGLAQKPQIGGVIRWLDAGGRDVMVLEDSSDTTFIWVFEDSDPTARRGGLLDVV